MENRTHIVHDRTDTRQRTLGYRIADYDASQITVVCAETRCHPNDNFCKRVARGHVENRLNSYMEGNRSPRLRVFRSDIHMAMPKTARDFRELEDTLLALSEYRLPIPAALKQESV